MSDQNLLNLPVGIGDFQKLRERNCVFVDKTPFIKDVIEDTTEALLIARPRRFGKTLNMSMLRYFFDIQGAKENRKLFDDCLIAKATQSNGASCMDEQGQYPVVYLTLKDLRSEMLDSMMDDIVGLLAATFQQHEYLLDSKDLSDSDKNQFKDILAKKGSPADLKSSLKNLSKWLCQHHQKKVIVLLDEYDTPMHVAYTTRSPFHEELQSFMSSWLGAVFKDNPFLYKGVLTGILRVSLVNLFSGVNSVMVRTILRAQYAEHFGFTESEVNDLFKRLNKSQDLQAIKDWYNGYQVNQITLYNPWSIICCLDNGGRLEAYWAASGEHGIIGKALATTSDFEVFDQLQRIVDGETIEIEIDERTIFASIGQSQKVLWSLLLFAGYLKPVEIRLIDGRNHAVLMAPNREVRTVFERIVENWGTLPTSEKPIYNEVVGLLSNGDIDKLESLLQRYIAETVSYYDFEYDTEERFYHIFLLGMMLMLKDQFIIDSNKESGFGRFDIVLLPKDKAKKGLIIEIKRKRVETAKEKRELMADIALREDVLEAEALSAVEQIEQQDYVARFQQAGIHNVIHVGIAFFGKYVAVRSKEVDIS